MNQIDLGVIPFAHNLDYTPFQKVRGVTAPIEIHLKTDAEAAEALDPYSLDQQSLEGWIARILRAIRAETAAAIKLVIHDTMQSSGNTRNLAFAVDAAAKGWLSSITNNATGFTFEVR